MASPRWLSCSSSCTVKKLPSDFDIFSAPIWRKPLCIQTRASGEPAWAQRVWAISFPWGGKIGSWPPPWVAGGGPRAVPAWLVRGARFPQHEIGRVLLVGRHLDAGAGDHVVERAAREL